MTVALVYFAVLALAFFLLVVRPQRRRVTTHRDFVQALARGDEVITTGGLFGVITDLDDDTVSLEVAPAVVLRVARMAIAQRVPAEGTADEAVDGAGDEA
jgi:preprotein translocase subunit YajC